MASNQAISTWHEATNSKISGRGMTEFLLRYTAPINSLVKRTWFCAKDNSTISPKQVRLEIWRNPVPERARFVINTKPYSSIYSFHREVNLGTQLIVSTFSLQPQPVNHLTIILSRLPFDHFLTYHLKGKNAEE